MSRLLGLGEGARDLAGLLSLCAEGPVAWHVLEGLISDFWDDCQVLVEAGLVEAPSRGGPVRLLARQETRKLSLRGARGRKLQGRFIAYLLEQCRRVPSLGGLRESAYWLDLIPQLEELAGPLLAAVPSAELGWPFVALSRLSEAQGDRPRAAFWSARAVAVLQARLGPEHLDTATAYNNLAAAYHQSGHYPQSEELYRYALQVREKQLGPEHPYLVTVLTNLAGACRNQGKLQSSLDYLLRAAEIVGMERPESLPLMMQLAETYLRAEQMELAASVCRRALALVEKDDPNRSFILQSLASVVHKSGQKSAGHSWMGEAVELQRKFFGSQHPALATTLNNWGVLCYLDGDLERSRQLLGEALEIRRHALGASNPETQATAANLQAVSTPQELR
ncbi:MAG: tetratricopeptide repeat protein [Candidatus Eremiobacteraeota bacterium]|nr:tetratricopeptide repeat protein [Candidatus Eremiobacteraeota bacterium]MCW5870089.1 tetratricopeptide repeat protein [Candidatus Eremiobacteraeota bacterium]